MEKLLRILYQLMIFALGCIQSYLWLTMANGLQIECCKSMGLAYKKKLNLGKVYPKYVYGRPVFSEFH